MINYGTANCHEASIQMAMQMAMQATTQSLFQPKHQGGTEHH
jgi:hypothetical protein